MKSSKRRKSGPWQKLLDSRAQAPLLKLAQNYPRYRHNPVAVDQVMGVFCNEKEREWYDRAPIRIFDCYILSHIYSGRGKFCSPESGEVELPAGSVVILPPDLPTVYGGITGTDYQEDYLFFNGSAVEQLVKDGILVPGFYNFSVVRFLPEISDLLRSPNPESLLRAWIKLQKILLEVRNFNKDDSATSNRQNRLLLELAAHPEHWWSVNEMADYCGCSENQLRKFFVKETGLLPKHYVEYLKLQYAAKQIAASNRPIDAICAELGFRDRSHFSRRFREVLGMTPGQYRTKICLAPEEP